MKQKNTRNTKKVPQIIVVTLLSGLPICYAETALATSSSFGSIQSSQSHSKQLAKANQQLNLPKNYQGSRLYTFSTPSEDDLNTLKSTLSKYQSQLDTLLKNQPTNDSPELQTAIDKLQTKIETLKSNIKDVEASLSTFKEAKTALDNALKAKTLAQKDLEAKKDSLLILQTSHEASKQELQAQQTAVTIAQAQLAEATDKLNQANQLLTNSDAALTQQNASTAQALQTLNERQTAASAAQASLQKAQEDLQAAQQTLNEASSELNKAQQDYDTKLIPDPTWTAPTYQKEHTRLVPETTIIEHVETTTTQSPNILPDLSHTTWSGAGTGAQGSQPTINQGVVKFSYMMQGVSYIGQTNSPANTPLTLSVDVRNMDANRGIQDNYKIEVFTYNAQGQQNGYAVYNSPQGWHEWTQRSVSVTPTSDVASYKVVLSAIDGGFWWGTYGPEMKNPTLSATITTTTITYEEVTTYREEKYYTTEPVLIEGTIQVSIDEGQTKTYTAPEGAVFIASDLRYEAKQRPECGIDIKPNLDGTSITISASNGVWGDPCGGWYKHVIGTITYEGAPKAPLIHDPALLPPLLEAQLKQSEAQESFDAALATSNEANANSITANSQLSEAQDAYSTELQKSQAAQTSNEEARSNRTQALDVQSSASTSLENATGLLDLATSNENSLKIQVDQATSDVSAAEEAATQTSNEQQAAESKTEGAQTSYQRSLEVAGGAINSIPALIDEATTIFETPQGSPDIPTNLDADSLQEIDLSTINPTELTEEQADLLVEAALETFETAEQGSPAYEQALDALALAAQQDDIVLDESLASIPGVGAAAQAVVAVFNIVGNVGADISPKVRKKAQEVVVTTLVVGQIAQNAAMATAAAAGFRRRS